MDKDQMDVLVNRFLSWKIPEDFRPDNGISFEPIGNNGRPFRYRREPSGTNLLSGEQARELIEHLLEGYTLRTKPADLPTMGEVVAVGIDTDAEWSLETRAFYEVNNTELPHPVRDLIAELWQQYCAASALIVQPIASERETALREAIPEHEGWRYGELLYRALYEHRHGDWSAVAESDRQSVWYPAGYRLAALIDKPRVRSNG